MTKAQAKTVTSPFVGMSVNELIALATAQPAQLPAIQAHAAAKLADLKTRTKNQAKLGAWASIVDGTMTGWGAQPAKPVAKAKKAKAQPKADKEQVLAALTALIASM